ncbi:MAG TPA: PadR family transcriptional regulator, partial [Paenirhodobacter sp.]
MHHDRGTQEGPRRGRRPLDYGALRLLVLTMIAEHPRHGYELIKAIETLTHGRYVPSPGVIYPTLGWLDDLGYVETQTDSGRKSHRITPEGQAYLAANRAAAEALMARDWSQQEEDGDPIRAGMQAIKSALREMPGDPAPAVGAAIAQVLQSAAKAIRIQYAAPVDTARSLPTPHRRTGEGMDQIITRHRFDTRRRDLTVLEKTHL